MTVEEQAAFIARRLRSQHAFSDRATYAELEQACRSEGLDVVPLHGLQEWGLYVRYQYGAAVLVRVGRGAVPGKILAHELAHHRLSDGCEHGTMHVITRDGTSPEERICQRVADLLCGEGWVWEPDDWVPAELEGRG